jgi:hypothetical protein
MSQFLMGKFGWKFICAAHGAALVVLDKRR